MGKDTKRKRSFITREFITVEDWKSFFPVRKYLLPFVFLMGLVVIMLGNMDGFFIFYHAVLGIILMMLYTKQGTKKEKKAFKERGKLFRWIRITVEVLIVLILSLQAFDTFRYGVAMAQIQFKNEGYVTVTGVQNGDIENARLHANEYSKEDDKVYQHIFDGWVYKSRVDITDRIKEEMEEERQKVENGNVGVQ